MTELSEGFHKDGERGRYKVERPWTRQRGSMDRRTGVWSPRHSQDRRWPGASPSG